LSNAVPVVLRGEKPPKSLAISSEEAKRESFGFYELNYASEITERCLIEYTFHFYNYSSTIGFFPSVVEGNKGGINVIPKFFDENIIRCFNA
jgi:hypothetical protein